MIFRAHRNRDSLETKQGNSFTTTGKPIAQAGSRPKRAQPILRCRLSEAKRDITPMRIDERTFAEMVRMMRRGVDCV